MKNEAEYMRGMSAAIIILGDIVQTMQAGLEGVARLSDDAKVHALVRDTLVFTGDRIKELDEQTTRIEAAL